MNDGLHTLVEPLADLIAQWITDDPAGQRAARYEEVADNGYELGRLIRNAAYTQALNTPDAATPDRAAVDRIAADGDGSEQGRALLRAAVHEHLAEREMRDRGA